MNKLGRRKIFELLQVREHLAGGLREHFAGSVGVESIKQQKIERNRYTYASDDVF